MKIKKVATAVMLLLTLGISAACAGGPVSTAVDTEDSPTLNATDTSAPTSAPVTTAPPAASEELLTMADVVAAFENEGVTVDMGEKPLFEMVNAQDGVMFYLGNQPVKLYEFTDDAAYNQGVEMMPILANMPRRRLVVLDSASEDALAIFEEAEAGK